MTRTKLRNIFLQNRSEENRIRYIKQRKTNKIFYENAKEKSVIENKLLWKNVKPFLSDKTLGEDVIHLIGNNKLVKTEPQTAGV